MSHRRPVPVLALGAALAAFSAVAFVAVAPGCGSDYGAAPSDDGDAEAGAGADAGTDGSSAFDPCAATPTASQCLNEASAFFVSASTGNDTSGIGSREKPYFSIGTALRMFTAARRRIYVCAGTYPEDVQLTSAHSGASIIGGFSCDWQPSQVKPVFGNSSYALRITRASHVTLSALSFHALSFDVAGSSIAAFVATSEVAFLRVAFAAESAADAGEAAPVAYVLPSGAAIDGNDATVAMNASAKTVTCPGGDVTVGGAGGADGFPGGKGTPGLDDDSGKLTSCSGGGQGMDGVKGVSPPQAAGASVAGELTADGWFPKAGATGAPGGAGQGGGGGAGVGGAGGGGGAGGCGGVDGPGGPGGGASLALAVYQSTVSLEGCTLASKNGGNGAKGTLGQPGAPGGRPGVGQLGACSGGKGGPGGDGAPGGGGAGGLSVGILYSGPAPMVDAASKSAIVTGAKGAAGAGPGTTAGLDGVAAAVLEVK